MFVCKPNPNAELTIDKQIKPSNTFEKGKNIFVRSKGYPKPNAVR